MGWLITSLHCGIDICNLVIDRTEKGPWQSMPKAINCFGSNWDKSHETGDYYAKKWQFLCGGKSCHRWWLKAINHKIHRCQFFFFFFFSENKTNLLTPSQKKKKIKITYTRSRRTQILKQTKTEEFGFSETSQTRAVITDVTLVRN